MARTHASLSRQTRAALEDPSVIDHLRHSLTGLAATVGAIQRTKGSGWAAAARDDKGAPLFTAEEQQRFTAAFAPHIKSILGFFDAGQKGGQAPAEPQEKPKEAVNSATDSIASLTGLSLNELSSKKNAIVGATSAPGRWGIDELYTSLLQRVDDLDTSLNHYASQYGILHLEKAYDMDHDVHLIPPALSALTTSLPGGGVAAKAFLDSLKVPFRMLVFGVYLFLDVSRITAGITGMEESRRMLSIIVCLLDFLRGDWKKAILSFLGYYGMAPMLYGQTMRGFLTLFRMLSPTIQKTFIFGALDTVKSLAIGFLLAAFQMSAPESVRLPVIGVLEKIAQGKAMIDGELVKAGMTARGDHFAPTFEDLNNLQSLMEDRAFLCSTEYQTLLEQVDKSAIMHLLLQLMRIPVTAEFRELRCGAGHTPRPFLEELARRNGQTGQIKERSEANALPDEIDETVEESKESADTTEESKESEVEEPKEPADTTEESKESEVEEPEEPQAEEPKELEAEEPKEVEEPKEPEAEEPKESEAEEPKESKQATPLPPVIGGKRQSRRRPKRM